MSNYDEIEAERNRFIKALGKGYDLQTTDSPPFQFLSDFTDFSFKVWLAAKRTLRNKPRYELLRRARPHITC